VTCIVAGDGWMAADRRITNDDGGSSSLIKVGKNPWLIAAASGNATSTLDVKRAIRKGAQNVDDLIEHVDKDSYALVMTLDGGIFRIESERSWACTRGELHAIGSGGDLALGYLSAHERIGGVLDPDMIRLAFRFVAKKRTDCGGGVDFRFVGR
jgi:hypothetical protein